VLGGVAIVVAVSELVRASPLPAALGPLLAAAAVTCYITAAYAGSSAYAHVIPSRASLHVLATIARQGFHDVHKLSTPVPTHQGLVLLAVVGIAAVALVVDLMAVTMRRAAVAGLPLLATFALCTSTAKNGAGLLPFAIGCTGYLWLLLADSRDRLSRWGRPLGDVQGPGRPRLSWSDDDMPAPLSVMSRRIGLSAIAVGVIVPLLIPGLHGGIRHGGSGLGIGNGSSEKFTVNPIVTIRGQLTSSVTRTVMAVSTNDPDPGYLRMTALDRFDGTSFAPSTLQQGVEAQVSRGVNAPLVDGPVRSVQVAVGSLDVPWLPLPVQVKSVRVEGDWRYDPGSNTVFSARTNTDGLTYTAQFVHPNPTAAQLNQAVAPDPAMRAYLDLPSIPQSVRDLTHQITAHAHTPFARALAIQDYLNDPLRFHYDISVAATGSTNALADFLLKTRRGFCQQFASAMAVMARIAGLPSRVAVGFTRGRPGPNHTYVVTTRDAHAWPEVYFSGYGWLPFEPTPRADGQAQEPSYTLESAAKGGGSKSGGKANGSAKGNTTPSAASRIARIESLLERGGNGFRPAPVTPKSPNHTRRDATLAFLALLAVALIAPSLVRIGQRRRRWRRATTPVERASAAWAELRASAIDAKAGWADGLTPRATARVLRAEATGLDAADAASLDRVVAAVQRAWYARDTNSARTDGLVKDVNDLRRSLLAEASPGERLVLRLWPRSVLADAQVAVSRFATVLDAVDMAGAKLRARLRPRHAA
jgi:transglutaminase-like putative cysteine protease